MPNDLPADPLPQSFAIESLNALYRTGRCAPLDTAADISARLSCRPASGVWISTLTPDQLRTEARRVMQLRDSGLQLPLYGIPFAVKDNIDVESMPTTAACPKFAYTPSRSATVVEKLRQAGAMLVGKTNLDQFAAGLVGTRSPFGICRNSFNPRYISGGSSSGSAVAVATGLVSFALGTDTAGSGRVPAGFNNIVGYKPTRGLLSTQGVVPACKSLDCVSVFALTSSDAAAVASVAAGYDAADPFSRQPGDLRPVLVRKIAGLRFGIPSPALLKFFGDAEAERQFTLAINQIQSLGGIVAPIDYAPFAEAARLLYEGPWVAERLASIEEFISRHPDALLPVTRSIISAGAGQTGVAAFKGMQRLASLRQAARSAWDLADVLLLPTTGTIYTVDQIDADPIRLNSNLGYYTNFVNLMDLCAVAVPTTIRGDGLPAGITLVGQSGADDLLLSLASEVHYNAGLTLGATGCAHPPPLVPPAVAVGGTVDLAVVGAHLSGQPLNHQLTSRKAERVRTCRTARRYRLFALPGTTPPKPGMIRVAEQLESGLEVEVWRMSIQAFGDFVAAIPAPLGIGTLELEDGSLVKGFICEAYAVAGAMDITQFGGWRNFLAT